MVEPNLEKKRERDRETSRGLVPSMAFFFFLFFFAVAVILGCFHSDIE